MNRRAASAQPPPRALRSTRGGAAVAAAANGAAANAPAAALGPAPAPPSLASRSARAESVASTTAARSRLGGDSSARKRRRVFSGERPSAAPSGPSASSSPRAPLLQAFRAPFEQLQQSHGGQEPQRLRPSLQQGPNGAPDLDAIADRCKILAIQSKSVLDFYGRFQYESWTDHTISRMNSVWQPFESYKVRQLLAERDFAHHFVDIAEIKRDLNLEEEQLPPDFVETMHLVNFATFIHYVFQIPTSIKALGELEDGRVTLDIALQAPVRALNELNDARRVFLKWIVPSSWPITDEILFMFLDLSTFIHAQRVRLYMDAFTANQMSQGDLDNRVDNSIVELMGDEVLYNSLSLTAEERNLSSEELDRIRARFVTFAGQRADQLARHSYDWLELLRQWPISVLTDELLQLVEKAVKDSDIPLHSRSLRAARAATVVSDIFERHQTLSASRLPADGNGTVIIHEAPGESTPRPREQPAWARRYAGEQQQRDNEDVVRPAVQRILSGADEVDDAEGEESDDEDMDEELVARNAAFKLMGASDRKASTSATASAAGPPPSSRQSKARAFSGVDLAGDDDAAAPSIFTSAGRKGTVRMQTDDGDEDEEDDILLQERDDDDIEADDPHERSQIIATRNAARGRISIGADAAKGKATGRAMSSHVRDVVKGAGEAPPSPLGARSKNAIGIGKDNKLTRATGAPKMSILNDKSKGERIQFDEDGDDDVFFENQTGKQKKKTSRAPASSSSTRRTTRKGAEAAAASASSEDEAVSTRSTRSQGKQRAVEESPLEAVPEEGTQQEDYVGGGFEAGFDGGNFDDDEGMGLDDIIRRQQQEPPSQGDDADDQDGAESETGSALPEPRTSQPRRAGKRSFPAARPSTEDGLEDFRAQTNGKKGPKSTGASDRAAVLAKVGQKRKHPVEAEEDGDEDSQDGAGSEEAEAPNRRRRRDADDDSDSEDDQLEDHEEGQAVVKVLTPQKERGKLKGRNREADEGGKGNIISPRQRPPPKKRRRTVEGVKLKPYIYATEERRFWSPDETRCLMEDVHRLAHRRLKQKRFLVWDQILARHGPHGKISHRLERRNNVQLKDKARAELQRICRERERLPYWCPILFPYLLSNLPKGVAKKLKIERTPQHFDDSSSVSEEPEDDEEDEDEEEDEIEDDSEEGTPPPAQRPAKSKSKAGSGSKSKSKAGPTARSEEQEKDDDYDEEVDEEDNAVRGAVNGDSQRVTRSSREANGGAAGKDSDLDGEQEHSSSPRRTGRRGRAAAATAAAGNGSAVEEEGASAGSTAKKTRPKRAAAARS